MLNQKEQGKYKIGIYVRESRDDKGENYETIETQINLIMSYANNNYIDFVYKVYIDDNVSGSGFERKGLGNLRTDIEAGNIDLLLLKDLSRLGRNNAKTLLFLDYLEEAGVRVITLDGRFDSSKDNDTVGIDTWYNERYIKDISKKIRTNLRHKIENGEYIGNAPFGYKKSSDKKNKLIIDENSTYIVKEIFTLYKEGFGYSSIAKILNQKHYPSPSSSKNGIYSLWNSVAVSRILSNRVYTGDTIQGVSQRISFKSKKTRRLPQSMWVVTENTHEAIIKKTDFQEIAQIRQINKSSRGPHKNVIHVFKGLLICGKCGSTMIARKRENKPIGYICGKYARNGVCACSSHYEKEYELIEILKDEFYDLLKNDDVRFSLKDLINETLSKQENPKSKILDLENELNHIKRQQDILYTDRLDGKISEQLFLRTNRIIENKLAFLYCKLGEESKKLSTVKDSLTYIEDFLVNIDNLQITNGIAQIIIEKVIICAPGDDFRNNDVLLNLIKPSLIEDLILKGGIVIIFRFKNHVDK